MDDIKSSLPWTQRAGLGAIAALVAGVAWVAFAVDPVARPSPRPSQVADLREAVVQAEEVSDDVNGQLASNYPVEACKAAIALINGRDPAIISGAKLSDNLVHVLYESPDDGKRWQSRCEITGDDTLRWATFDAFGDGRQGRWRDEDIIKASVKDGQLHIELNQSGVIKKQKSYVLTELAN